MIREEFERGFIEVYPELLSYLQRELGKGDAWESEEDAKDILQAAFGEICESKAYQTYDPSKGAALKTWLIERLKWRCLDFWRDAGRERDVFVCAEYSIEDEYSGDEIQQPQEAFCAKQRFNESVRKAELQEAIDSLPFDCRGVVELWYQGCREKEIGQKLCLTRDQVAKRWAKGKKLLKLALADYGTGRTSQKSVEAAC